MNVIRKFKSASPAAKASLALLFANLVVKGLSMISGPIFTRIMPSSQYGIVSTFSSWQSLLMTIVTLNLGAGVFNNGMLEYRDDRDSFQYSLTVLSTITAIIFAVVYFVFRNGFNSLFEMQTKLVILMILHFVFVPVYGYWGARQRYEFKYKALTMITIALAFLSMAGSIVAVLLSSENTMAESKILFAELPSILVGVFFYMYIAKKSRFKAKKDYILYALKFNLPLIPHYLSMYVLASSDRIMISKMVNTSATAIYSVSYTVGMVISILWQSVDASLSPWIYEKLNDGDKENVQKRTFQILLIFLGTCLLSSLFAPEIMAVLATKEYFVGVYVIPSIAASAFFIAAYSIYMRVELYYKQTKFAMIATAVAAIINLILNYIFIPLYGFIAAGYTTLASYVILYILHYVNVKKHGYGECIDNKKIVLLSIIVIVCSFALNVLYHYNIIRYAFILVVLLVVFIMKKKIANILGMG